MKKISYYLALIVLLGVAVVSFWIYQKYFRVEQQSILAFQVVRGDLQEAVSVRGEVVSQKDFDLEFPFSGTIEQVYVKDGQKVKANDPLMKLKTNEFDIERGRLNAVLKQDNATLEKLLGGAQIEDIRVSEAKVAATSQALKDAENTLTDAVQTSFTQADDAVRNKADQFFSNPHASNATFTQDIADGQLKTNLGTERFALEPVFTEWSGELTSSSTTTIDMTATHTQEYLVQIKSFLLDLATAINSIGATGSITQTTLDSWKTNILTARTAVDASITAIVSAQEKVQSANSARALAQSELALKQSKPQSEDVVIAEAQIEQTKNMILAVDEKIRESTLRAPGDGIVKKVVLKEKEVFNPGMIALAFASSEYKVQADVSELDINKVHYADGSQALVRFDALPGKSFTGKVVFIEPKEVIKNEDIYFRTDIFLDNQEGIADLRSGMSADVVLYGALKKNVLTVPELAVEKRGGVSYVKVAPGATKKEDVRAGNLVEHTVTTGVSDGESVEILTGLNEGEVVVVSS